MMSAHHADNDDARLIALTAQGDEHAFAQLIRNYQPMVFSIIYRYTGNYECVEDLAQEIFIKVWRNAGKFKMKSKFSTWMYRIVVNHCLNYNHKHRHKIVSLDDIAKRGHMPDALKVEMDWDKKQMIKKVRQAVSELPERQRIALVLAHYEHKSHDEIARIMRISISSVHSLIFRARCSLRKKLKELLE
jgi:RNA polymerase sigma-70 factor (ECF subfamily)